ncbi:ribosomal L28e/Mak16 [Irpex lacteus]|nr:ribosomal L28e/Mak16 [Irpex lacteus]
MSSDLVWLLTRKSNAFLVKRVPEGPIFSKEHGNLLNLHSYKYSGIANEKAIHVAQGPSSIQIVSRKEGSSPHAVRKSFVSTSVRSRSGPRRAAGVVAAFAKRGYRPDLRKAALARTSALILAQKEKKATPPKKARGKKAAKAASA